MHLVRISNEDIKFSQAVQVVFGNYFLALLTPGATGGAVAGVPFCAKLYTNGKSYGFCYCSDVGFYFLKPCCMPIIFYFDNNLLPWLSKRTISYFYCCNYWNNVIGRGALKRRYLAIWC